MYNLLYITPTQYTSTKRTGGMGTKTEALRAAWSENYLIDVSDDVILDDLEFYDIIMIELLGFRNRDFSEKVKNLKKSKIPVVVYGSDSELLRWTGNELDALAEVVTFFIPNMEWQADYFRDFDLPVSDIVYEPIDCDLFRPAPEKQKTIVAGGAISLDKQSDFFLELFRELAGIPSEYRTAYIGSAGGWNDYKPISLEIERELKQVTDDFHGQVSPQKVASIMSTAGAAVLNPFYETCNRFDMELMASGVARVCSPHVCYDHRIKAARFDGSVADCIKRLSELTNDFSTVPDTSHGTQAQAFAQEHWSYEASLEQLNAVLRGIL